MFHRYPDEPRSMRGLADPPLESALRPNGGQPYETGIADAEAERKNSRLAVEDWEAPRVGS